MSNVHDHAHAAHRHPPGNAAGARRTDPVCGMSVDPQTAAHRWEHAGETYVFCSAGCLRKFRGDPRKYLGAAEATAPEKAEGPADALFTLNRVGFAGGRFV